MSKRFKSKSDLLTLAQAAERYGFRADYLRQLVLKGKLKAQRVGSIWLTTPAHVEEYLARRKKVGRYKEVKKRS